MSTSALVLALALVAISLAAGIAIGWLLRRERAAPAATSAVPTSRPGAAEAPLPAPAPAAMTRPPATPAPARSATPLPKGDGNASPPARLLAGARSWGYQLQGLDIAHAASSPFDVLVIDYSRDGSHAGALKPAEITRLQRKRDGSRRLVIAYLSIGEAESYRAYWRKEWKRQRPAWLLSENPEWDENYAVCFWDPGWQANLCGSPDAYLDRILAQGFDGIYLDKCDVGADLEAREKAVARQRADLDGDMVALVRRLAAYARERRPGFLLIMQNAEPLLERPELRAAIDGVGKEELLYGLDGSEKPNSRDEIAWSRERLDLVRAEGKTVLAVEYLSDRAKIAKAVQTIRQYGYVPFISDKSQELDRLDYTIEEA